MVWKPDETVAAVVARDGRCLLVEEQTDRALDTGIVRAVWLGPDEIRAGRDRHRSPLVVRCMHDYLAAVRAPLDLLVDYN